MSKIIQAPEVTDEFLQCWMQCNNVNVNDLPSRPGRNKVSSKIAYRIYIQKRNKDQGTDKNISSIKWNLNIQNSRTWSDRDLRHGLFTCSTMWETRYKAGSSKTSDLHPPKWHINRTDMAIRLTVRFLIVHSSRPRSKVNVTGWWRSRTQKVQGHIANWLTSHTLEYLF